MNQEDQEFRDTLELLREAHQEPIAEAHYAAVRARVLSQLAARQPWWRGNWRYGFAAVALAAMLVMAYWPKRQTVEQVAPPASRIVEQAELTSPPAVRPPAVVERLPGRRKRLPHHSAFRVVGPTVTQPIVVKLVTNDPNVVIYWISGE